ncbi:MAG: GAF domain-containing protein [Ardenticatenaceae bacterium]|nr:GAF domain-containing protein [Ardenticatenaceae bacterium]
MTDGADQWRWVHTPKQSGFDENGRITYFNGIIIDVTEQKQAQETLAQINQVLERQVAQRTEEMAQRWQEAERRRQVAESLRGIMRVLNSRRPLSEVLDYIIKQASQVMEAEISLLYRLDYERQFMHIEARHGLPAAVQDVAGFPVLDTPVEQQIMARQPAFGPIDHSVQRVPFPGIDPAIVRRWHTHVTDRHDAFLAIPLVVGDEVYGRLTFYYASQRSFDQEDIDQAMLFGDQVALAIENAQLRDDAEEMAVIGERHRLARELHDAVTQTLFSASLIADVLPRIWERNPATGAAKLEELRELTRGALAEMRTLLLELRPATLTESSLAELLRQLAAAVIGRSRLQVDLVVEGERPLPPETQVALYRIAQEALNNIVKHAGATQVMLRLRFGPDCVEMVVVDNGRGFDTTAVGIHSLGLGIMRERAAKIAADLQVESIVGQGTTIRVQVCE